MAHDTVQAGGDDLLVFLDLNRRCGVGVGAKNQKCNAHADENSEVAEEHQWDGNYGPAEAMVESRQDDHGQGKNDGEKQDKFLSRAGFGARAGLEAVLNEMRIGAKEIKCDGELCRSEDCPEQPGLPEMKSPSGQEKQNTNEQLKKCQPGESVSRKSIHRNSGQALNGYARLGEARLSDKRTLPAAFGSEPKATSEGA